MISRRDFAAGASCAALSQFTTGFPARANEESIEVLSGHSLVIDGDEILLEDIVAPAILDISNKAEPFAEKARAGLAGIIGALKASNLDIRDTEDRDRWGRRVAHVYLGAANASLQEQMVENGFARVRPHSEESDFIRTLLAKESAARKAELGLWRLRKYSVVDALDAGPAVGAFNLVEGKVVKTAAVSGRTYVNFGEDYKTDFTITARSVLARRWAKAGIDMTALEGAYVRGRGFVEYINGPSIELSHPLQIEIIETPAV